MPSENLTDSSNATTAGGNTSAGGPRLVLQTFEGPLDLLLHLIRVNEISITDIPILEICRQYDAYLGLMEEMNLTIAGEFLVMAATLAHIKSRILLPAPPTAPGEEPEDPRADLVRQLLEHQRMKAAADVLRDRDESAGSAFLRGNAGEDPLGPYRSEAHLEVSLFDLLAAFKRVLEAIDHAEPLHVQRDTISVAEKIAWILDRLEERSPRSFRDLIAGLGSRAERIVAFLAILELIRLRLIRAMQRHVMGEILIERAGESPAGSPEARDDA